MIEETAEVRQSQVKIRDNSIVNMYIEGGRVSRNGIYMSRITNKADCTDIKRPTAQ